MASKRKQSLTAVLHVRMTDEEYALLAKVAGQAERSLSDFSRRAIVVAALEYRQPLGTGAVARVAMALGAGAGRKRARGRAA